MKERNRREGSKKGFHKGCFGSPSLNVPKRETGRNHRNEDQINKAKQFFRDNPRGIVPVELAKHLNCSQSRAMRIIDILSGSTPESENFNDSFLVYSDDEYYPTTYHILIDRENTS